MSCSPAQVSLPPFEARSPANLFLFELGADVDKPDWNALKDFFLKEGVMEKRHVVRILKALINLLSKLWYFSSKLILKFAPLCRNGAQFDEG